MATIHCGQCGTQNPAANTFCSSCGARLSDGVASAPSVQGKPAKKKASARQTGCGCLLLVVVIVVIIAAATNSGTKNQQAAAPAVTETALPAVTDTAAVGTTNAAPGEPTTPMPATETAAPATETPADTATPLDTATPHETALPTASPQQQADFRTFTGFLFGLQQDCTANFTVASNDLTAITQGGGDMVQAYADAKTAHDECNAVAIELAGMSPPDSLSGLPMEQAKEALETWENDVASLMSDDEKVLQNADDLADAADAKSLSAQIGTDNDAIAVPLVQAAMTLGVTTSNITPVVPTPTF